MIDVKNLNFIYPNNKTNTLHNINFTINKGEVFGLLGPSGAGKSTTQKILTGILKKYSGYVVVMNQDLKSVKNEYYEHIGVSFELPNLYLKFTAKENLEYFKGMYSKSLENTDNLLKMVNLQNHKNTRVSDFSKGMKMRLNFCRAFINDPEIIFLDEPTSGLDPVNARQIKDIILEKKKEGKTIFLTTHNMGVAEELCDNVAFMVDGKIELIDSPRNLKVQMGKKRLQVEYMVNELLKTATFPLKNIGKNQEYLQLILDHKIDRMYTLDASLEDVFIKVTGRGL